MIHLHVVLVEPEIHWNTGNAGRTCLAAGAQLHLVGPLGFSLEDKEVRRAGLDYLAAGLARVWPDWAAFERELPALGAPSPVHGARPAALPGRDPYPKPAVLIFGRESVGPLFRRSARVTLPPHVRIPDAGFGAALARPPATSVALALYEVRRQWGWSRRAEGLRPRRRASCCLEFPRWGGGRSVARP